MVDLCRLTLIDVDKLINYSIEYIGINISQVGKTMVLLSEVGSHLHGNANYG